MKRKFCYEFPKADHTVDAVVFSVAGLTGSAGSAVDALEVLLIRRRTAPFEGAWALPGGFVAMAEGLDAAIRRELEEETGLRLNYLEQLYTFGEPGRDPRGRVISTAYMALVNKNELQPKAGTDAADFRWSAVGGVLSGELAVAFDHREIVGVALTRLRSKLPWQPVGMELLPPEFSLTGLQRIYELILGRKLDKRNFRKKALAFGVLEPTRRRKVGNFRPVQLYRFNRAKYGDLVARGLDFEI